MDTTQKTIMTGIIAAAIALPIGITIGTRATGSGTNASTAIMTHEMNTSYDIPNGVAIPAITDLQIVKDNKSGWNISFETQNFTFTPQNASSSHIDNEGHAHIHVDGAKVSRLYSNAYHLDGLEPGAHTISIYLNTNDHKEYTVDGAGTGMDAVITQEEN